MNSIRNKVQLIGNLGKDPELKTFENGKLQTRFSLATKETYRDSDGKKVEDTQWHNLVAWGGMAKTIQKYLNKGSEVAVEGRLVHRTYDDKEGKKCFFTEVVVGDIVMMKGKEVESV
jgi:single-strand DNA-binding protein